jgi:hypothetical protein
MKKLWLLGIAVVLALILGPMLVTFAEDSAPPPPKHERKADGIKGDRSPEITLTPAQEDALGEEVTNLRKALDKLQAKAETVLKDRDQARRFVMQTVTKETKAAVTEGAAAKRDGRNKKAGREK